MNAASSVRRPIPWPRLLRQIHLWLGVFFAPSIVFFAVTGGLQELKLHEAHGDYTPPPVIEKLGQVHIHQKFAAKPQRKPEGPPKAEAAKAEAPAPAAPKAEPEKRKAPPLSVKLLQAFFVATAIGLTVTTLLGLWIGVVQARQKLLPIILLIAGSVIPVAILMI